MIAEALAEELRTVPWLGILLAAVVSLALSGLISYILRARREVMLLRREVLSTRAALQRVRPGPDPKASIIEEIEQLAREVGEIRSGPIEKQKLRALISEQLGRYYFGKQQYKEALDHFEAALANDPTLVESLDFKAFSQGFLSRTVAASERGELLTNAERDIRRAIELARTDGKLFNTLGWILDEAGQLDEAIEAYRKSEELEPGFAVATYNRACSLAKAGRHEEALRALEAAITKSGSLKDVAAHDRDLTETLGRDPVFGPRFLLVTAGAPEAKSASTTQRQSPSSG